MPEQHRQPKPSDLRLENLPKRLRLGLQARAAGTHGCVVLAGVVIVSGCLWGGILALVFRVWESDVEMESAVAGVVFTLVSLATIIVGPTVFLRWLANRRMRRHILDTWTTGRPPICYACNYDLRGSPGDACPECGEAIPTIEQVLGDDAKEMVKEGSDSK